jgi:methionyl-tRNA synthetase
VASVGRLLSSSRLTKRVAQPSHHARPHLGIPVPRSGFEGKVFYDWFDAPIA